jgi:hypothetical protein
VGFIERALPLARRGYYVFPLSNPDKIPLIEDWPNRASNNPADLVDWSQRWPDANVGCIGRYIIFLEDDRGDLEERYEKETGRKFPVTFAVATSLKKTGMNGKHHHFLETPESMVMGSRRLPGVFDFQADPGHQFVGPYSVHKSGHVYTPVDKTVKPITIPNDLLEWIGKVTPEPEEDDDNSELIISNEWNPDLWLQHVRDIFTVGADGISSICPLTYFGPNTGHKHSGSAKTGFRFDRGYPEFHCFSTDGFEVDGIDVPHDQIKFGGIIRHLNQYHDPYPGKIWDKTPEQEEADLRKWKIKLTHLDKQMLDEWGVEEDLLGPEYRYALVLDVALNGIPTRIYSNDGINWCNKDGMKI